MMIVANERYHERQISLAHANVPLSRSDIAWYACNEIRKFTGCRHPRSLNGEEIIKEALRWHWRIVEHCEDESLG